MSEREIFLAVLDLPDPAARAAYLDQACGMDAALREKVEGLLRSHNTAGGFLGTPAVERPDPDHAGTMAFHGTPESERQSADDEVPLGFLTPSQRPDSLGRIGHYEVLQVLGQGGFGIVLRAFDDVLHRVVAVKVLAPHLAATSPARKRFLREARTSAAVRHDNVVQVYEVGETPLPYIAMEFIPGETLQQRLDRIGPIEPAEVVRIGRQIAEGLAAAHANDLIHRDIKPGNVLIEGGQQKVKITDFGLARAADDASISQSGIIAGTPMYMAPEQAKGDKLDQRADLFSLGSVLYQMACGRPPFRANSTVAVLKRVAEDTPRDIREIVPETPQWLCDIIAKLHAKKPDERFQSAREVADLLADCEAQLKGNSKLRDLSRIPRMKSRPSGRRKWAVAAVVLLLPIIALAATELSGATNLFRGPQANTNRIKPVGEPIPDPVAMAVTPQSGRSHWTILKPIKMKSEGGATLMLQPDDSVLVSGKLPDRESYTLTVRDLPATIQALRLEVLPHDALPNKGPGRHPDMAFVLSTVRVALEGNQEQPRDMKLKQAWADYSVPDAVPEFAIDADHGTGWCSEFGKPHFIAFELDEPVAVAEGMQLHVTLEFKHEDAQRSLGCFRLSAVEDCRADRKAAEYVLSLGGSVRVDGIDRDIKVAADLPGVPFRLTTVGLHTNQRVTDAGLTIFKDCKHVTELDIGFTPVTDVGLAYFRNCKGLEHLYIPATRVTDGGLTILKECKQMRRLQVGEHVTDAGLAHLKECKVLELIQLADNKGITDTGVAHLAGRVGLTDYLGLANTQVTDAGLTHLKTCLNLRRLGLDRTNVSDAGLLQLTGLRALAELTLTESKVTAKGVEGLAKALPGCKITWDGGTIAAIDVDRRATEYVLSKGGSVMVNSQDTLVKAVANLPTEPFRLTGLHLWNADGNQVTVTDTGLAVFKDCRNLTQLVTYGTPLSAAGLAHFKECKNLTILSLEVSAVTDEGLAHFKDCKNLTFLRVTGAPVTGAGIANFKDCTKLTRLDIPATEMTDAGLAHIGGFKALEELELTGTKVTAKGVEEMRKALPKCKIFWDGGAVEPVPVPPTAPVADTDRKAAEYVLSVGGEIKINEQGPVIKAVADLPREAFRLTWVGLPNNKQVTDAGLAAFKDCKNIGGLQLEGTPVTDAGLIHLKDCTSLTGLDLSNTKVTDAGLIHLKGCTKLTYLQLADIQATEAGLAHFKECKNLMYLNLARTQVGDAGLTQLKDRNNLATLGLEGTPITDAGLAHLTGLDKLFELRLAKSKVTAKGVEDLMKTLPKCKITWDGVIEPK